jgi:hypothetical protein
VELLRLSDSEIRKIGLAEFARRLGLNSSNLAKMLLGKRALSSSLREVLKAYFQNDEYFDPGRSSA